MANFNERIFKDGGKKPFRKNRKYLRRDMVKPLSESEKLTQSELIEKELRFGFGRKPKPGLIERPPMKRTRKKPVARSGGGIAQRGLGRAFMKGGKV